MAIQFAVVYLASLAFMFGFAAFWMMLRHIRRERLDRLPKHPEDGHNTQG